MNPEIDKSITFLGTNNLEKTHEFYTNVLKLEMVLDQGSCRIYKIVENSYVGFCKRIVSTIQDNIILTIVTSEVDHWYERFLKSGMKELSPPEVNEIYKIYHFFIKDPNGYTIEFQKFLHPFDQGNE